MRQPPTGNMFSVSPTVRVRVSIHSSPWNFAWLALVRMTQYRYDAAAMTPRRGEIERTGEASAQSICETMELVVARIAQPMRDGYDAAMRIVRQEARRGPQPVKPTAKARRRSGTA